MTNSKQIAGLIGPTMIVLAASEALNFHIWENNIPPVTYLNGTLLFVAGLATVRAHNRWKRGWPILVTLAGWIVMLGGLYRMFAPEAPQAPRSSPTYAFLIVLFAIGILLSFKAYGRGDTLVRDVRSKPA
jgi:hypothetical protein